MQDNRRAATPPSKPVLIFDGDCRFCRLWIRRWEQATGNRIEYVPQQNPGVAERFPEIPRERLEGAVHLVEPDGRITAGAGAVFRVRAIGAGERWALRAYETVPGVAPAAEAAYRFVAGRRQFFSLLTRLLWGEHVERPTHLLVRRMFLVGLGLVYLIAFASLGAQVLGLAGKDGIAPVEQFLRAADQHAQEAGVARLWQWPTLCWWNSSDGFLQFQCVAGAVLALLLMAGVAPVPCLLLLWLLYLSLTVACGVFLGFQWDALLLETGFLALFFAPARLRPGLAQEFAPSRAALWLLRWLLFRLMFASGCVKLLSGDAAWSGLTALNVHYETQPLPNALAWWAHQLPEWAQKTSCAGMFAVELAAPFLIFAPRRLRFAAFWIFLLFQAAIALTGNYTFFNLLSLVLCVPLLDDRALLVVTPKRSRRWLEDVATTAARRSRSAALAPLEGLRRLLTAAAALVLLAVSGLLMLGMFRVRDKPWLAPVARLHQWIAPFRSVNSYGLFAVMTTTRPEIIIEGSRDGTSWRPYEFKHKPGDPGRRPAQVAPHQPRLDWQMWFAALGRVEQNPWFVNFSRRLLQGSPDVLALLDQNPFPDAPPRFVRASLYEYRFTDRTTREKEGVWWRREFKEQYLRPVSLEMFRAPPGR